MGGRPVRLALIIDNYRHDIDSTDPELLGKWMVEIFARVQWTPATYIQVNAQPSYLPQLPDSQPQFDWIADSRIMGQLIPVKSPREVVEALSALIDEYEAMPHD